MNIDAIILSNSSDLHHYGVTCRAINSLKKSDADNNIISIIIVESQSRSDFETAGFSYHGCQVIHPEQIFRYNKFLNIGLTHCKSDWILICNNDLFFTKKWLSVAKDVLEKHPDIKSFSPICPNWHLHQNMDGNIVEGHNVSREICGWCILLHRSLVDKYDLFDEQFDFWYQDNDYAMVLQSNNEKHALMVESKVYHMVSASHDLLKERINELTHSQHQKFIDKWEKLEH